MIIFAIKSKAFMKFTKEEAFESLKGMLTNNGKKTLRMSEKSINKQLDTLIPLIANDEMELNDFVSKVKDTFSVMNSNAEKDNSDFIKQWEKDHPSTEPKDEPKDKPSNDGGSQNDDVMAKMMKRLEELEKRNAEREKEIKVSEKRSELLKAMKEKGIKDEQWSKDLVAEISLTEDLDVEAKADSFLKLYNKTKAASGGDGVTPLGTSNGGDNKEAHRFDYLKKKFEREEKERKDVI